MDRQPLKLGLALLGPVLLGLALLATGALAQPSGALKEEVWLAQSGRLDALTREPASRDGELAALVGALPDPAQAMGTANWQSQIATGQYLFKTPALFGGQAAKAGLSCHSCHVNGRGNPHFRFPGISDAAGTADITHSFFSKTLGNQTFDPVPIPDLFEHGKVDRAPGSGQLEAFIRHIIVEEFAGDEPAPYITASLSSYVRALGLADGADDQATTARSMMRDLDAVAAMAAQASAALGEGEREAAALLLAGARHRLALVHERIVHGDDAGYRRLLEDHARGLGVIQRDLADASADPLAAQSALAHWLVNFADRRAFAAIEQRSLYNRERLAGHLSAAR